MLDERLRAAFICPPRRVLELFAGIGGLAAAWPEATITAAVDINQTAAELYRRNFLHPYVVESLEAWSPQRWQACSAEVWWLSPPCQPFTRRGQRRDIADPRTAGLMRVIEALGWSQPQTVAVENVLGFEQSQAFQRLVEQLERHRYHWQTCELCPTQLGWPNRRPRFYLLADRRELNAWRPLPDLSLTLQALLPNSPQAVTENRQLEVPIEILERYISALDRVDWGEPAAVTACFAASYGKTWLQAGSYLATASGYRRFAPHEIARLLGFSERFQLDTVGLRSAWKLLGNSLSLASVRYVLSHVTADS